MDFDGCWQYEFGMSKGQPIDALPLDLLLALQEAMIDPSQAGVARAALRARHAGFHIHCLSVPKVEAIALDEPTEDVDAIVLRFD